MNIGKYHSAKHRQNGAVLFMALMFLVLSALFSLSLMDISMVSRKMAGNSQFQEEAMQITEGLVNEIANTVIESFDNKEGEISGEILCRVNDSAPACTLDKKLVMLSGEMQNSVNGKVVYRARFSQKKSAFGSAARMPDSEATEGLLLRYVEIEAGYDGIAKGLSRASLAVGVVHKSLVVNDNAKKLVKSDMSGTGAGTYKTLY